MLNGWSASAPVPFHFFSAHFSHYSLSFSRTHPFPAISPSTHFSPFPHVTHSLHFFLPINSPPFSLSPISRHFLISLVSRHFSYSPFPYHFPLHTHFLPSSSSFFPATYPLAMSRKREEKRRKIPPPDSFQAPGSFLSSVQ